MEAQTNYIIFMQIYVLTRFCFQKLFHGKRVTPSPVRNNQRLKTTITDKKLNLEISELMRQHKKHLKYTENVLKIFGKKTNKPRLYNNKYPLFSIFNFAVSFLKLQIS